MMQMIEDKFMRVLLMFDMPTKTKKEQKHATKFRNNLIKLGYFMMQFSVYMRICKGLSSAKASINAVKMILPPQGNVRVLIITEKQFDAMEILLGNASFNERINAEQNLVLFNLMKSLVIMPIKNLAKRAKIQRVEIQKIRTKKAKIQRVKKV